MNYVKTKLLKENMHHRDLLVLALALFTDTINKESGDHLHRIRVYSKILAEELSKIEEFSAQINPQFIQNIYDTSLFHDIGKIGIPDSVLQKPGHLTKDEYNIVKGHSIIGENILIAVSKRIKSLHICKMAVEIAGSHHERWDGKGYPKGLKDENIPLSARIVALADVYDALRSVRPYKESYSHEKSLEIIVEGSGNNFDPSIVDAFTKIERTFQKISIEKVQCDNSVTIPSLLCEDMKFGP